MTEKFGVQSFALDIIIEATVTAKRKTLIADLESIYSLQLLLDGLQRIHLLKHTNMLEQWSIDIYRS